MNQYILWLTSLERPSSQESGEKLQKGRLNGKMKVAFYHEPTAKGLDQERRLLEIENSDQYFPLKKNENIDMVPFLDFWDMR